MVDLNSKDRIRLAVFLNEYDRALIAEANGLDADDEVLDVKQLWDEVKAIVNEHLNADRQAIIETIESAAYTLVSTDDSEGIALTAAILQRAANIALHTSHPE